MATGEEQSQHIVANRPLVIDRRCRFHQRDEVVTALSVEGPATNLIDRLVASYTQEPRTGRFGHPGAGPLDERRFQRLLERVLRQPNISAHARESSKNPAVVLADDFLNMACDVHWSLLG